MRHLGFSILLALAAACGSGKAIDTAGAPGGTRGDTGAGGDDSGTAAPGRYHPDGWSDPSMHGPAAKCQDETCTSCHGSDLTGGGSAPSCDSCHPEGWKTDCTFCHGGTDNQTGAPPEYLLGDASGAAFTAHTAHVEDTSLHVAWSCDQCHVVPEDVLSDGHVFVGDDTSCVAEVDMTAGLSAAGSWNGASCGSTYCHGSGRGDDGSVSGTGSVSTCHDCHGDRSSGHLSGRHSDHFEEGVGCDGCHATVAQGSSAIRDPALHVDGTVEVDFGSAGVTMSGGTCTGSCHGEYHWGRSW